MLPTLTFAPRRVAPRRAVTGVIAIVLLSIAAAAALVGPAPPSDIDDQARPLTERLAESTWALALPSAWLAASLPEARVGDRIDLLAVRAGDRPLAIPLAADLRVMSLDERSVVLEVDEESATAIATARASGLLLIPLLRSTR
jgi:hypothetical protein